MRSHRAQSGCRDGKYRGYNIFRKMLLRKTAVQPTEFENTFFMAGNLDYQIYKKIIFCKTGIYSVLAEYFKK